MDRGAQGTWEVRTVAGETVRAFVPACLPPDPPLAWDVSLANRLARASVALGRLDGLSTLLPDVALPLYYFVRQEAVLSSRIEGTRSTLSDLLLFESEQVPGVPLDDVREVSRAVAALEHGVARLDEFPLSMRLLCEVHAILLAHGRGSGNRPGEIRNSQNWIGGSRPGNAHFVPPPPHALAPCLSDWERFLHDIPPASQPVSGSLPTLVKAALAHAQFETIHPFLDGNGRVGRLLITLLLCADGVLRQPFLPLSVYFRKHQERYYALLDATRFEGKWEAWVEFFLEGVAETATQASELALALLRRLQSDRAAIEHAGASAATLRVLAAFQRHPFRTAPALASVLGLTPPTIRAAIRQLEDNGVVREISGRHRNRVWVCHGLMDLLEAGIPSAGN